VLQEKPELFIFLGDNIYGDTKNMTVLHEKYNKLGWKAAYQKMQQNCEVIATWDDHDYGTNNGDTKYA
jgi:alkaline phosphatase D